MPTAPDDQEGLTGQLRLAVHGRGVDRGGHGSARRRRRLRRAFHPDRPGSCAWRAQPAREGVALIGSRITLALRQLRRPGGVPGRPPHAGSAGPAGDVRSVDTGGEQSRDAAGRPPPSQDPRPPPSSSGVAAECEALDRLRPMRAAGRSAGHRAAGRAGDGQERAAGLPVRSGSPGGASRGPRASNRRWSSLTRPASAVRAHARPPRRLPGPQRDALATVFGLSAGPAPGPVPGRAGDVDAVRRGRRGAAAGLRRRRRAVARPGSAQILAFVARRLLAEPIAIVFAARTGDRR